MGLFFDKKFKKIVPLTYCKNSESVLKLKQISMSAFFHPAIFHYPAGSVASPGKLIMKKTKKRKLFYCKRCTGKFSKDFVKKMDGYYICLTCAGIEEYLNDENFFEYSYNGGRYKARD